MSTKTTFKRVALVAVAALGFGTLSVAPSTAAVNAASLYHSTPASIAAGAYADFSATTSNVLLTLPAQIGLQHSFVASAAADAATIDVKLAQNVSVFPNTNAALPVQTLGALAANNTGANANATTAISGGGMTVTTTAVTTGLVQGSLISTFTPTVAGTYIVTFTAKSGGAVDEVFTWTVVAHATQAGLDTALGVDNVVSAAKTTSFLNAGEAIVATADVAVSATMATGADQKATIVVTPKNAAGATFANATFPLTATIAGPGTLGIATAATAGTIASTGRAITGTAGQYAIGVFSDGTSGVATVTISTGTTVLATETVTFYGAATKITPTVVNSVLAIGANTGAVTAVVTDALGTLVPGVTVYASSDTDATIDDAYVTSVAASDTAGLVSFNLSGVAVGTAKITLTLNSTSAGTSTVSAVAGTMRVSDGVATKVVYAFDKDTYAPGEAAKITATVSNAAGVMAAGTYTVLSTAVTANFTLAGLPGTLTVVALASTGVATYTTTIPAGITGALTLTGAAATGVTATFGTATVVNFAADVAQSAADAAAEAIDAANAATDAANAAAEAADAATAAAQDAADAVAALSVQVSEEIAVLKAQNDALRKQLIALTNLIIKIQKKVKA